MPKQTVFAVKAKFSDRYQLVAIFSTRAKADIRAAWIKTMLGPNDKPFNAYVDPWIVDEHKPNPGAK